MKYIVLTVSLLFSLQIYGQEPNDVVFTQKVFSSVFSGDDRSTWPQVNNEFYFFLVKDSSYIIECNKDDKKAFLLPKAIPQLDTFRLEAEIAPDGKKDDGGVAGLAFDVQQNISGGYLLELNSRKQYRVVSIGANGDYSPISNNRHGNGWTSYPITGADYVKMSIAQAGGKIYISLNGNDVLSYPDDMPKPGQCGLFISGVYKTRVKNFNLYKADAPARQSNGGNTPGDGSNTGGDISTLNDAILECRKENKDISAKYETSMQELAETRKKIRDLESYINQNLDMKLQQQLKEQTRIANDLKTTNDSLKNEMEDLQELRKIINANKDRDLIMVLSENLKKEQQKNAELEKKLKKTSPKRTYKKH